MAIQRQNLRRRQTFSPADIDIHLEQSVLVLKKWLRQWKPVIHNSSKKAQQIAKAKIDMLKYVKRSNPRKKYKNIRHPILKALKEQVQLKLENRQLMGFEHNGVVSKATVSPVANERDIGILKQTHIFDLWGDSLTRAPTIGV